MKVLMLVNLAEGAIHLIVSTISLWGIYDIGIWDWRVLTSPITDFFLGIASLITGFVLKDFVSHGCMHNLVEKNKQKDK